MSTPILNPNSTSRSQMQVELGKILRQHDPNAIRLYDFFNHVKVFLFNSTIFRWENNSCIEGNLFAYEKYQIINNQRCSAFAFAVINREQHLIQDITSEISEHAEKQCLFYEIVRNNKCEVFSLHFANENECQRLHAFINRSTQKAKEQQQSRATIPDEFQLAQTNGQERSDHIYRQRTPVNTRNTSTPSQLTVQQSIPVIHGNSNNEDPTSSLKRLLNIPTPNNFDNDLVLPQQQSNNLLPPSAFQMISHEPDTHLNREHIRHVFLHLVQHNDHFLDIIHQACSTHQ